VRSFAIEAVEPDPHVGRWDDAAKRTVAAQLHESDAEAMDIENLMASFLFGLLGTAMFMFGKKAGRGVPLACGLALMVLPSVIPSFAAMMIVCATVAAIPVFLPA
jgi:hypothetical protein